VDDRVPEKMRCPGQSAIVHLECLGHAARLQLDVSACGGTSIVSVALCAVCEDDIYLGPFLVGEGVLRLRADVAVTWLELVRTSGLDLYFRLRTDGLAVGVGIIWSSNVNCWLKIGVWGEGMRASLAES
jgi:hypothetical protein